MIAPYNRQLLKIAETLELMIDRIEKIERRLNELDRRLAQLGMDRA